MHSHKIYEMLLYFCRQCLC